MRWHAASVLPVSVDCTMLQANALTGWRPPLSVLAEELPGWMISKEQQVSDWSAPSLTHKQLDYAALDAVLVRKLPPIHAQQIRKNRREHCYQWMRGAEHAVARMELTTRSLQEGPYKKVLDSLSE